MDIDPIAQIIVTDYRLSLDDPNASSVIIRNKNTNSIKLINDSDKIHK